MVLHFHPLRRIHLRHQGNKLLIFYDLVNCVYSVY
jgi:hypothetical protein